MKATVREKPHIGLTDQEKGIIFGVCLGTFIGQFIFAIIKQVNTVTKVTRDVGKGR